MNDLSIFICAHNKINNKLPKGDGYIIAAQNENVTNTELPVIILNDEFTQKHKIGYGECCQIHHMWKHPEKLCQYVGFCHYRRFFEEFMDDTSNVKSIVDSHGAIFATPWSSGLPNHLIMRLQHFEEYIHALLAVFQEYYPDDVELLRTFLNDKYCSYCNMFIMKKEDFLEGAEFVFGVLDKIDEYFNVHDDESLKKLIVKKQKLFNWNKDSIKWQVRMEGFISEYLWDIFKRKKFKNSYVAPLLVCGDRDMSYQSE